MIATSFRVDASGLNALTERARAFNRRTPALAANVAGLYVARQARFETHQRSVPVARIDSELSVSVTPRISARTGRPVSRKTRNPNVVTAQTGGRSYVQDVPFTWLIIGARAKPFSRYNRLTGQRYALPQHPLRGQPRSRFARIMAQHVTIMVNRRHSSSGFLQSGWIASIRLGERAVPAKYRRYDSAGAPPPSDAKSVDPDHGAFIPAQEGALTATCEIQNRIGLSGTNSTLDAKRNQALWEVGAPLLQSAINIQAERTAEYVARKESEETFRALEARGILHYTP